MTGRQLEGVRYVRNEEQAAAPNVMSFVSSEK